MKTLALMFISLCIATTVSGQVTDMLTKYNWVKVLEENVNDSIILYGEGVSDLYMKAVFNEDTVTLFGNPDGGLKYGYTLSDKHLELTDSSDYIIDMLNDTMLVLLSGITDKNVLKRRRMIFMEENYLFDKVLKLRGIGIINDKIILTNNIIYPTFSIATFYMFLNWYIPEYKAESENGILSFRLIFTPDGHLITCETISNEGISKSFAEKVRKLVARTDGFWDMPGITTKYDFELIMCIWFPTRNESVLQLAFPTYFYKNCRPPEKNRYSLMLSYLDNGIEHLEKGEYEKSLEDFNTCLKYSTKTHEDIYYNRAYAYYKLNKMTEACTDWSFLSSKGQRYATKLYSTFCR